MAIAKNRRGLGMGKPEHDRGVMYVLEFEHGTGFEWFWGYETKREAQADLKKYASDAVGGKPRKGRVTTWRRV